MSPPSDRPRRPHDDQPATCRSRLAGQSAVDGPPVGQLLFDHLGRRDPAAATAANGHALLSWNRGCRPCPYRTPARNSCVGTSAAWRRHCCIRAFAIFSGRHAMLYSLFFSFFVVSALPGFSVYFTCVRRQPPRHGRATTVPRKHAVHRPPTRPPSAYRAGHQLGCADDGFARKTAVGMRTTTTPDASTGAQCQALCVPSRG